MNRGSPRAISTKWTLRGGTAAALVLALLPLSCARAAARAGIEANTSFWWTVWEQAENGLTQRGSGDEAADVASGFNFRQGRLAFSFTSDDGKIEAFLRLRLEERTDVIDFWGGWRAGDRLRVRIGQMKIPSTAEVLTPDHETDFITRSTFGRNVADYALSRTPYISSIMAARSWDRDLGAAVELDWPSSKEPAASLFLMASNGIGANKYIGGRESEEFVFTNSPGDLYYGMRAEFSPIPRFTAGIHASTNEHSDMALDARGPVFDIDRSVWTVDSGILAPGGGRVYCFYGSGEMRDFHGALEYLFDYSGWGVQGIQPLAGGALEVGARFDRFVTGFNEDGDERRRDHLTLGVNLFPADNVRVQVNYVHKETVEEFEPDTGDDILYVNFQFFFDAALEVTAAAAD